MSEDNSPTPQAKYDPLGSGWQAKLSEKDAANLIAGLTACKKADRFIIILAHATPRPEMTDLITTTMIHRQVPSTDFSMIMDNIESWLKGIADKDKPPPAPEEAVNGQDVNAN